MIKKWYRYISTVFVGFLLGVYDVPFSIALWWILAYAIIITYSHYRIEREK